MTIKRLYQSVMLSLQRTGTRRGDYLRKHGIFHHIGKNVSIQSRVIPLYPELISLHNNVHIASQVTFITHDISNRMLNGRGIPDEPPVQETIGCIEIMDNVFVGAGVTILYNVRIGSNVIIAAGSVVTKDIPPNSVVAGVPAKVIESFDDYLAKRNSKPTYPKTMRPQGQQMPKELEDYMWNHFQEERK